MPQNQLLAEVLDKIAIRTERMAWVGSAHPSNPEFRELMAAQDHFLKAAEQLLNAYQAS